MVPWLLQAHQLDPGLWGRGQPFLQGLGGLLREPLTWALERVRGSSLCQLVVSYVPGLGALRPEADRFRIQREWSIHMMGHCIKVRVDAAPPRSTPRPSRSDSDADALRRVSTLTDQNQALQRQLKYSRQQHAFSDEAGTRVRSRSQHLASGSACSRREGKA
ncbi:hypothetical protein WJX74_001673 [Apatococcus lobatus]|uniref:Uncharacterized protein n=1 Tax=Apatococcus lobatus TaxID=904363 RepID=A0AAW1QXF6_9CHLO